MSKSKEEIEQIAKHLVDSMLAVHRELGPGLLESTYQACLAHELQPVTRNADWKAIADDWQGKYEHRLLTKNLTIRWLRMFQDTRQIQSVGLSLAQQDLRCLRVDGWRLGQS